MTTSFTPEIAPADPLLGRAPANPLPEFPRTVPPATARRYRAWSTTWIAGAALAAAAWQLDAPAWVQSTAAGALLPGGGLFATGHAALGGLTLALFAVAIFLWWAVGTVLLPPIAWLGSAVAAGLLADTPPSGAHLATTAAVLPSITLLAYAVHRFRHRRQQRTGRAINQALAGVTFPVTGDDVASRAALIELTREDLEFQRYAFDLALQPLDRFDGFAHHDQFREAALRYQLFFLGYTLSMAQYTSTPAFSGYLAEAQQRAIEKVLDRRVWGYWALENAWGNLSLRRDPIDTTGNVMLTGYLGTQIGLYETLNDRRYSAPGSLSFQWSGDERYAHSYGSVAESIVRNIEGNDFALFSCEPNWIYSICNTYGLNTLLTHDRLHGTDLMGRGGDRMRRAFQTEFLRPDGKVIGMRSKHLGLTWNFWTGVAVQLTTALWLHPAMPDFAQRTWWLLRPQLEIRDGLLKLPRALSAKVDPGNYSFGSDLYAMSIAELTAREMGDEEIARAARRTVEATAPVLREHGAAKFDGMSPITSMYSLMARSMRAGSLRDLVAFGAPEAWTTGPRLSQVAYPEVLVARAETDGRDLRLVLHPGADAVRTRIEVDRLTPHGRYRAEGVVDGDAVFTADVSGRAGIRVDLGGRTEVAVRPA
jgi:hypothetical protein